MWAHTENIQGNIYLQVFWEILQLPSKNACSILFADFPQDIFFFSYSTPFLLLSLKLKRVLNSIVEHTQRN